MGENIDKMKICLISETGEEIELSGIPELTLNSNDTEATSNKDFEMPSSSCEVSLNIKPRSHVRLWLALIGFPTSNN
ncbi:hypothetical protein C8E03_108169 [Lachnotalea glycerini]|uniref:Uncharacterized protein n=1 Tax=Lachnotalea glycerini TaxID=1763509 RepID=A0A318EQL3_9FIRM|nr:hypothetical protein [Lachnotalea glycerini]PXV88442.1 hypothetical protein C8E03_108169 [Lachnotalea glycerini]